MDNHYNNFDTNAGALCLSFANTFDIHDNDKHEEMLREYIDLVEWARLLEVIDIPTVQLLRHEANAHPNEANTAIQAAWALRQTLYNIFASIAHDKSPAQDDLNGLNKAVSEVLNHHRIVSDEDGFRWGWDNSAALDQVLWPVIRDAADLLTGDSLDRVGQCADVTGCGWLFLDVSRNRSRRWCSMETCGNRAKAMRHYRRTKE
ncbi:MAG: ABATE domain-containing protein [Chloroflexota bacterium]